MSVSSLHACCRYVFVADLEPFFLYPTFMISLSHSILFLFYHCMLSPHQRGRWRKRSKVTPTSTHWYYIRDLFLYFWILLIMLPRIRSGSRLENTSNYVYYICTYIHQYICLLQVMWNNKVGDLGADAFLKVLDTNLKISKLYLTGNKVSETRDARICFAHVWTEASLQ